MDRTSMVTLTVVIALASMIAIVLFAEEGAAYSFDGEVEGGQSVWFNITVMEVEDDLMIRYSTAERYSDDVAIHLFDENGTWLTNNISTKEILVYDDYRLDPGVYSLAVMGTRAAYGWIITFYGTCNYPIEPFPVHTFGHEGLKGQMVTYEFEVNDLAQDLWLSIYWLDHEVDEVYIRLEIPDGRLAFHDTVSGNAVTIHEELTLLGTYTLMLGMMDTLGHGPKLMFGACNRPVSLTGKAPGIDVTQPTAGDVFDGIGDTIEVRWDTHGDAGDEVKIELDGPYYYMDDVIAERTPNDGEFNWTIEGDLESEVFSIRIVSLDDPSVTGWSHDFRIVVETIEVLSPEEGSIFEIGDVVEIEWEIHGEAGDYVEIALAYKRYAYSWGPGPWDISQVVRAMTIKETTPNDGHFEWTIPEDVDERDDYLIEVESTSDSDIMGTSGTFEVTEKLPVFPSPSEVEWFFEGTIDRSDEHYFKLEIEDTDAPLWVLAQWDNESVGISFSLRNAEGTLYDYEYDRGDGYREITWDLEHTGLHILELYKYTGPVGLNEFNISSNRSMELITPEGSTTTGELEVGSRPFFRFNCPDDDAVIMLDISYVNASATVMAILTDPVGNVRWYDATNNGNLTWSSFLDMEGTYTLSIYLSSEREWSGEPVEYTIMCNFGLERTGSRKENNIEVGETHQYSIKVTDYDNPIFIVVGMDDPNASAEVSIIGPNGNVLKQSKSSLSISYVPSTRGTYKVRIHLEGADDNETSYNISSNLDLNPSSAPFGTVPGELCLVGLFGALIVLTVVIVAGRRRRKKAELAVIERSPSAETPTPLKEPEAVEEPVSEAAPEKVEEPASEPKPPEEEEEPSEKDIGLPPSCMDCNYPFKADDARFCPVCGVPRGEGSD